MTCIFILMLLSFLAVFAAGIYVAFGMVGL